MNRVGFLWLVIISTSVCWSLPDLSAPSSKRRILVLAGSLQKRFIDMLFCSCKDVSLWDSPSLFFTLWAIAWSLLAPFYIYPLRACLFQRQGWCQEVKKESTGKKRWSSYCRRGRTWLWSPCPSGKTKRCRPTVVSPVSPALWNLDKQAIKQDESLLCHLGKNTWQTIVRRFWLSSYWF